MEELSPRNDRRRKQSAFKADSNAERTNQRIHTFVIKLTRIRAQCIFGVALYDTSH